MTFSLLAAGLALLGISCLFFQWKNQTSFGLAFVLLGWGLLTVSIVPWAYSFGIEYGLVYALGVPSCLVWALIAQQNQHKNAKTPHTKTENPPKELSFRLPLKPIHYRSILLNTGRIIVVLPFSMIVSLLITVFLVYLLPVNEDLQLLSALLVMPIIWSVFAIWFIASTTPWIPLALSTFSTGFAGVFLFLLI